MLYASSKDYLRKKFVGISAEIQGTELDEVSWDFIIEKLERIETST
jgi:cofilin